MSLHLHIGIIKMKMTKSLEADTNMFTWKLTEQHKSPKSCYNFTCKNSFGQRLSEIGLLLNLTSGHMYRYFPSLGSVAFLMLNKQQIYNSLVKSKPDKQNVSDTTSPYTVSVLWQ